MHHRPHIPHMPHLHHSHSTVSLPISIDEEDQWDLSVPGELVKGTMMMKISRKHHKQLIVSIDPDKGTILYKSRVSGIGAFRPALANTSR
jgi:hypothetical protein